MNDYSDLMETGIGTKNKVISPEDQFFHSIYIPGLMREENHAGIQEQIGKLQIYGVKYNLNKVCMIMLHTKQILVKRDVSRKIMCFSFREGRNPKGTSGNFCPRTREDREGTSFCKECRSELIMSGLLCKENGVPINKDEKPIFVFVRGVGIKCGAMYKYLDHLKNLELKPIIFKDNDDLETALVNNKRYVTIIETDKTKLKSTGNVVNIFKFTAGTELSVPSVKAALELQKNTLKQFKDKFDYSKSNFSTSYSGTKEKEESLSSDNSLDLDDITNF